MSKSVVKNLVIAIAVIYMLPSTLWADHIPPHATTADPGIKCLSCHAAHRTLGSADSTAHSNVCLNCHHPGRASITYGMLTPFVDADMANNYGPSRGKIVPGKMQTSHKWEGSDNVPKAGALPPTNPQLAGSVAGSSEISARSLFIGSLSCARCHSIHGRPDVPTSKSSPFIRVLNANDELCLDCHRPRNSTQHKLGTHPVGVNYASVATAKPNEYYAVPVSSNPANSTADLSKKKLQNGTLVSISTVQCTTCHGIHFSDSNSATFDNVSSALFGRLSSSAGYLLKTDLKGVKSTDRNICTNCHITTDVNANAKVKNHNGNKKQQNIQCADCHGGHVDEADNSTPNVFLVRRFMAVSSSGGQTPKVLFQYTSGARKNYNKDAFGVCVACHPAPLPPSISQHTSTDARVCNSCHTHKQGFSAECTTCHGFPPVENVLADGNNKGYAAGYAGVNEALSGHASHATGATTNSYYAFSCNECHKGNNHNSSPNTFQDVFIDKSGIIAQSTASFVPETRTCSNVYCHSNGLPVGSAAVYATVGWANAKDSFTDCSPCHAAAPATNAHTKHISAPYNFSCATCHDKTVIGNSTIKSSARMTGGAHVNAVKDVQFSGTIGANALSTGTYNSGTYTCANLYCHTNGKGATTTVPVWTNPATGQCGTCHSVTAAVLPGAHQAHLINTYGPKLTAYAGTPNACYYCHSASNHINGLIEPFDTSCATQCHNNGFGPTVNWDTGGRTGVTCQSCHAGNVSAITFGTTTITAPNKSLADTKGHGKPSGANKLCTDCHNQDSAHINPDPAVHDKRLVSTLATAGLNDQCNYCHNNLARVNNKPQFWTMSTHFLVKNGPQAMQCSACHDAHGTSNIWMVKSSIAFINSTAWQVSFTNTSTGFIQPNNRGICQVCHTKTKFYRAGDSAYNLDGSTKHPIRGCLSCHPHSAKGGAFSASGGNCDTCHGYPPVPKTAVRGTVGPYKGTFGTYNNYTNAKYEDYSGGGGAHLNHVATFAKASDGWKNCAICHSAGNVNDPPTHKIALPIDKNVQYITININPVVNFNNSLQIIYSGAKLVNPPNNRTGSCVNVGCHFQPTPRWSKDR